MRKTLKPFIAMICGIALMMPQLASSDGMVVPPPDYWIQETDQKAVILYDKGVEHLVLSITFQGDAEDFGWVVPVPAKPTVTKGSDELFTSLEELTGYSYNYYDRYAPLSGALLEQDRSGVTIIETKKIDYYDVTVLSSTDEDSLTEWLQENDYNFPSSASYILNSYTQNDWYFVAMRINPQSLEWSDVSQQLRQGHATPVVLSFATKNIVYPLKISSITSRDDLTDTTSTNNLGVSYTSGRIDKGIAIDNNDAISFAADKYFTTEEGTLEMWIKPDASWSTTPPGYWELLTVATSDDDDVFEFRAGQDSSHDNLQFITYNPLPTVWKTTDQVELTWDHTQWYYLAATWSADSSPQIYINGVAQTMEASNEGSSWTMQSAKDGSVYLGQRKAYWGTNSARAVFDEVRISGVQKTADEIKSAYSQVLSNQELELEDNTKFLAHFDNTLKEEKTSNYVTYSSIEGASVIEKTVPIDYYDSYVDILLYVMADNKKTLPNFSTTYANWIDKQSIENLALDDQGDPLLQPSKKKYFLTELSRSMTYSDMTEDLFFRDAGNNSTIGQPIKSKGTSSLTPFLIVIGVAVVLSIALAVIILVISRRQE